jgi:hypothetical protein
MLRPEFVCSLCILSKGSEVYNYVVVDSVFRCTCYIYHLTCTWHECIYQHILHVPDMNVFINTSYMNLTWMYLPTHLFMYLTWMYLPAHLTCTWHECIYQHILHVPGMNVFTNTSYMYLTWMYLSTHLTCTWHECIYQHILHVPDMNAFTGTSCMYLTWMYLLILFMVQYRYMIMMRSEYVCSSCYTCTICNVHVYVRSNVSCVVRSDIVCSLCYIFHSLGLWYLHADVSNNLFLSICLLCMNFVVITTLLFVGLRVTYMYLYSFVLTLFSIQYYNLLCYIVFTLFL